MTNTFFITGTSTEVGKTYVSTLLLDEFNAKGLKTFGLKPMASGCQKDQLGKLKNEDALQLMKHASLKCSYERVNPFAFEESIAPHIAARNVNQIISKKQYKAAILNNLNPKADINLIEGAGGWMVPLNENEFVSEAVCELNIPIILVVAIELGCINHTLLTIQSMQTMGANVFGWIANCKNNNMPYLRENIATLKRNILEPMLGTVAYKKKYIYDFTMEVSPEEHV